MYTVTREQFISDEGGYTMNENKAGLGYQNFEEVRTEHIFHQGMVGER